MEKLLFITIVGILFTGGVSAEARKLDGKLLVTKDYWRFEDYTIQRISNKGITITYKSVFTERKTTIKPRNWPSKLRNQVAGRIYLDSKGEIYDMNLCTGIKKQLYKKGDYFFKTGNPVKSAKETKIIVAPDSFVISNTNDENIEYNSYQEWAMVVLEKISKHNYTVELLTLPSKKQLKAYFSGKPIKQAEQ